MAKKDREAWTDYVTQQKTAKRPKYGNKKVTVDGIEFDSKKEARRYHELKLMQQAGQIKELRLQRRFPIVVNLVTVGEYVADFVYTNENDEMIVEDVKSVATRTPLYQFKKKVFEAVYGIKIQEV